MSRKLSEEEKRQNELMRDDRQREKQILAEKELDERCREILLILRDVSENSEVQYNSKYFAKHFVFQNPTFLDLYISYEKIILSKIIWLTEVMS